MSARETDQVKISINKVRKLFYGAKVWIKSDTGMKKIQGGDIMLRSV